jgi:hypothetical protein
MTMKNKCQIGIPVPPTIACVIWVKLLTIIMDPRLHKYTEEVRSWQ